MDLVRILLIESNPEISDLIARQTLQPLGYQVEIAGDSSTAIQKTIHVMPDMIIMDLNMSGLSGKDLLVAFSSQGIDVPLIIIAESGQEEDIIQAFRLGASDYLLSPIRETEIVSAVERVMKQVQVKREKERLGKKLEKLNKELQQRVRELTTIYALGKAVTSITDQRILFDKIIEGALYITEADRGWILIRKGEPKTFYLKAFRGLPKELEDNINKPWDDGLSPIVALSGVSMRIHGNPLKKFKIGQLGSSALVVPLKAQKEVIGILVITRDKAIPFSQSNQAMLEAVADYAAISMVNAELFNVLERRAKKLQEVVNNVKKDKREKAQILHNLNQEVKSQLNEIKEFANLFQDGVENLGSDQYEALTSIRKRLNGVINIVSAVSAFQESTAKLQMVKVDLLTLAKNAINRHMEKLGMKNIDINWNFPSLPVLVEVDPVKIGQVFDTLLMRAIEDCSEGCEIDVGITISGIGKVDVTVIDSGAGMAEEELLNVFDPYYQIIKLKDNQPNKLFIDLVLAKEIIRSHRGEIGIESNPSGGLKCYFSLPTA